MSKKLNNDEAPLNSGAYRIYIKVSKQITIEVGRLGSITLEKGRYIYTGSAMKNLKQRIERHLRKEKKLHWHIDYLLTAQNVKITKIEAIPSEQRNECLLNQELISSGTAEYSHFGFGSSDCRKCKSHLLKVIDKT